MRVENTNNQFINNEIRKKINTFISKKFHILPVITSLCIATNPAFADVVKAPWSADTQLEIVKGNQDAPMPKAGDLVAIRFKGSYKGNPFDDTFSTDQPYLYR